MTTYVCGHRNPDVDSVTSAYALADLRRRTGMCDVEAICAGRLPARAKWVFDHFRLKPIRALRDVYVRVRELVDPDVPMIDILARQTMTGGSDPFYEKIGYVKGVRWTIWARTNDKETEQN